MHIFFKISKSIKTFGLSITVKLEDTINSYKKIYFKQIDIFCPRLDIENLKKKFFGILCIYFLKFRNQLKHLGWVLELKYKTL